MSQGNGLSRRRTRVSWPPGHLSSGHVLVHVRLVSPGEIQEAQFRCQISKGSCFHTSILECCLHFLGVAVLRTPTLRVQGLGGNHIELSVLGFAKSDDPLMEGCAGELGSRDSSGGWIPRHLGTLLTSSEPSLPSGYDPQSRAVRASCHQTRTR